ncbi:hypothetical protein FSOLCH5_014683 [Fusarium solani]
MVPSNNSNTNVNALSHKDIKLGYEEVKSHRNPPMPPSHPSYTQQQPWNVYPENYPPAQSSVHLGVLPGGEFWQISIMAIAPACGAELLRAAAASHGSI